MGILGSYLLERCDMCNALEERVFRDTWTGKAFCQMCLYNYPEIITAVTMSPDTDGDNLFEVTGLERD